MGCEYDVELKKIAKTPEEALVFFSDTFWYPDQLARTLSNVYRISLKKARALASSHVNPPSKRKTTPH